MDTVPSQIFQYYPSPQAQANYWNNVQNAQNAAMVNQYNQQNQQNWMNQMQQLMQMFGIGGNNNPNYNQLANTAQQITNQIVGGIKPPPGYGDSQSILHNSQNYANQTLNTFYEMLHNNQAHNQGLWSILGSMMGHQQPSTGQIIAGMMAGQGGGGGPHYGGGGGGGTPFSYLPSIVGSGMPSGPNYTSPGQVQSGISNRSAMPQQSRAGNSVNVYPMWPTNTMSNPNRPTYHGPMWLGRWAYGSR